MDLFDKPVHLYGKIVKKKFITPYKSYEIDLQGLKADFLPVRLLGDKIEVFSSSEIFNSYVLTEEENLKTLYSRDKKLTVTTEDVEPGRIYTFRVEKEDQDVRRVSLYTFDTLFPGTKTTGRVILKKKKYFVSTIYGEGELVLQNNSFGKKVEVLLFRKDDSLHFVQVDNPVEAPLRVKIDSISPGYYSVSDRNIKGILFTGKKHVVGELVECIPKDNNLGFYIFREKCKEDGKVKKSDALSKEQVNGPPSIPFDIQSQDEKESSNEDINENVDLHLERKRSKITTQEDCLMEISAHPGKAFPILKYFKYLVEEGRPEDAKGVFYEYSPSLRGKEKDDLSISFVNYLIYTGDQDLYKTVKRLSQSCSDRFLEVVSSNTEDPRISRLYYSTSPNRKSFRRYLEILFSSDQKEAYRLISDNPKYLNISIPFLYKSGDNPRSRVEALISKNRDAWLEYLDQESGEYKRHLFRRVVEYDWNTKDMKRFFRLWLEFETEECGNVDEVRDRAKEYVEKVKSQK